ncbi:DISARM system helicase DrmA [Calothrix sp. 336/3]|uniref:DISARM system helicase DrmA n=1 Tax=Calothrix sp. 336/3 TaxID=1337936 RepID=UPI0004E3539E|nr:DISARM system helicase DrmA [Calothrix sp. 336/3]AKG21295.1 helicase [Calothrix sp. 336/3]
MPVNTPAEVRNQLTHALQIDLVGPTPKDTIYAREVLTQAPSKWYLTGFIVPFGAPSELRADETANDDLDQISTSDVAEDAATPETASARKAFFPSSIGLSFLVSADTQELDVTVNWGDYICKLEETPSDNLDNSESEAEKISIELWERIPQSVNLPITLPKDKQKKQVDIPGGSGLQLFISCRRVRSQNLPPGTRSVSVFLVNYRTHDNSKKRDTSCAFQASLQIRNSQGFVPRPDLRGQNSLDWDEAVASLQYRHDCEFAVGHNVSAITTPEDGECQEISTTWIPQAEVPRVEPADIPGLELSMETLAAAPDAETLRRTLNPMVTEYTQWIIKQQTAAPKEPQSAKVAADLLNRARKICDRITSGLQALDDPLILEAFQIANRAIATARRQRLTHDTDNISPEDLPAPKWRPFQLAFLLLNIVSIAKEEDADREVVDLLFFPTGGGKTEAYLGLAAFTLVLRRLRDPSIYSAGLSVLMRYTLRLLTLDQLERAATLICALEIERQSNPKLGNHPFEIGLWVGQSATPNKMGSKGDKDDNSAYTRTLAYQRDNKAKPKPVPLERCPWCGAELTTNSFHLLPNKDTPTDLRLICVGTKKRADGKPACVFRRNNYLPLIAVDEQIYRRLPCFIIATVDKFANLPWVGQTGALFGKVTHYSDRDGFYGTGDTKIKGSPLEKRLPPPDLVIQDELHLISGPLGTMVGLYETAIDALCSVPSSISQQDKIIRPKIIASTATVRRADRQIQALFGRTQVDIFPAPGPDRHNSFFAKTIFTNESPGRLYVGVAAQGRSLKVVLLRTYLALLGAAQKAWESAGGKKNPNNPADPYMTLLGYFNSLRELGGSRRLVEDEVNSRLTQYGDRYRYGETTGLFVNRKIDDEPEELTSRVSTNKVANTKRRLALACNEKESVDVALATNMISVGLDITRLGLMVVLGQPKTAAEYIQTSSRVGRDANKPGLVVTLLNVHRPRDRSHYERFQIWHNTFYRAVEATSVTPFSPRAIDRGLAGVTVALARLGISDMTAPLGATQVDRYRQELEFVVETISKRAEAHNPDLNAVTADTLRQEIRRSVIDLIDTWERIAERDRRLQYQPNEVEMVPPLLLDALDPEIEKKSTEQQKFKAQRSLRDVEPVVKLLVRDPGGLEVEGEEP